MMHKTVQYCFNTRTIAGKMRLAMATSSVASLPLLLFVSHLLGATHDASAQLIPPEPRTPEFERYRTDKIDWNSYTKLDDVYAYVNSLAVDFPDYFAVDNEGKSQVQALNIPKVSVTDSTDKPRCSTTTKDNCKATLYTICATHAREVITTEICIGILKKITDGLSAPEKSAEGKWARQFLSDYELVMHPITNPDGRTKIELGRAAWRKNGNQVDINRNFDWEFAGGEKKSRAEDYGGQNPFSEAEAVVIRDTAEKHPKGFDLFITLHSGTQDIYIPYADGKSKSTNRHHSNEEAMLSCVEDVKKASPDGFWYVTGVGYDANEYYAHGTSFDYMAGVVGIPFSYTFETYGYPVSWTKWSSGNAFTQFNPANDKVQEHVDKVVPAVFEAYECAREHRLQVEKVENDLSAVKDDSQVTVDVSEDDSKDDSNEDTKGDLKDDSNEDTKGDLKDDSKDDSKDNSKDVSKGDESQVASDDETLTKRIVNPPRSGERQNIFTRGSGHAAGDGSDWVIVVFMGVVVFGLLIAVVKKNMSEQ